MTDQRFEQLLVRRARLVQQRSGRYDHDARILASAKRHETAQDGRIFPLALGTADGNDEPTFCRMFR